MPLIPLLLALAPPEPALAREIIAEINFARTRPRDYAERLRSYRRYFKGKIVYYPGNPNGLRTEEGVKAVDEAIRFLEAQAPIEPVEHSALLARAAGDHVAEQGPRAARPGICPKTAPIRATACSVAAVAITWPRSSPMARPARSRWCAS